jgi:hypothetical protein
VPTVARPGPIAAGELVLDRYRPIRPLGSGGSGSVWLARDERTGLEVALKIVPREGKAGSRAEREASAAARLRHERCLRAYSLQRDDRHVYIAYEYVPGETMREAIRGGRLNDAAALEAAAQVLDGLAHAHASGIVHRDVKPSNVLLAAGPQLSVRLLDFGLAQIEAEETLTAVGDVPGTLAYISPERLAGEQAGPAADIWAIGVMLWEALAGYHPFWTASLLETAKRIQEGAPSLRDARPDLPEPVLAAVAAALALDPSARPTATRLATVLRKDHRPRREPKRRVMPKRPIRPSTGPLPSPARLGSAAAAALFAGWTAARFPFFPGGWEAGLAVLAAALTLLRPRAGLAFALAVPVLPLGNLSLGLALLYSAVAIGWLALSWREPGSGLLLVVGPLLAPFGALALLPIAAQAVGGRARRAVQTAAAVLLAALVAGLRHGPLPLAAGPPPIGLGIDGSDSPSATVYALVHAVRTRPELALEGVILAAAAVLLPLALARGLWGVAAFSGALLAGSVLAAPNQPVLGPTLCAWVGGLALASRIELPELRTILARAKVPQRVGRPASGRAGAG